MMGVVVTAVVVGVLMRVLVAVDMLVLVMMFMLVVVVMVVLVLVPVRVLGGGIVAIEPGHVVIVILEFAGKLNIEIAGVDAVLVYAGDGNLKAVDRQCGELLA